MIVDNMSKLIDQPREAKPFLPSLMPEIKRLGDEMSDPEVRFPSLRAPSLRCPTRNSQPSTLAYHTYLKPSTQNPIMPHLPSTFNPIILHLSETLTKKNTQDPTP